MNLDLSEFYEHGNQPGLSSWYHRIVPQLSAEQVAKLDAALAERRIGHAAIAAVVSGWGFPVTDSQVGHYRRTHRTRG